MKTKLLQLAAMSAAALAGVANAVPTDYTPLTSSIDLSTISAAILAIGVALVALYVTIKGAKIVLGMVRGA
jgi:hypothetical protein